MWVCCLHVCMCEYESVWMYMRVCMCMCVCLCVCICRSEWVPGGLPAQYIQHISILPPSCSHISRISTHRNTSHWANFSLAFKYKMAHRRDSGAWKAAMFISWQSFDRHGVLCDRAAVPSAAAPPFRWPPGRIRAERKTDCSASALIDAAELPPDRPLLGLLTHGRDCWVSDSV